MPQTPPETDFGRWSPQGASLSIEYGVPVLEEICASAVDGLYRFRHGGVEIGGVLFGQADGGVIWVLAYRPLACEHAFGPRFVLSEGDRARLKELLYAARREPELEGMEPVGWYHSHTRSAIALSPRDLEVYNSYFPQRWQIALVMRPEQLGPARAGFFFREPDGSIQAETSYEELTVHPRRHRLIAPEAEPFPEAGAGGSETLPDEAEADEPEVAGAPPVEPAAAAAALEPEPVLAPVSVGAALPDLPSFVQVQPQRSHKGLWLVLAVIAIGASGFGLERYYRLLAPPEPLSLWVADVGGQLLIEWDRGAKAVREARNATLEIEDGQNHTAIPIDGERLRDGSVDYVRRSDIVDVRLRVEGRDRTTEEYIRFVGQPVQRDAAPGSELLGQRDQLRAEVEKLRAELQQKDAQIRRLRTRRGGQPAPSGPRRSR
ncbi:MAG: hypothetical protein ABSD27_08080 [Bryobacteraceae bacterium]|jgi:proteasome lid subunit RPN8/RPN11